MECLNCNKIIDDGRKFCSRSCSATYNNQRKVKKVKKCQCNNLISKLNNKYCDDCIVNSVWNKKTDLCEAQTDFTRKKILIATHGHHCSVCKNTEWNGQPIPLEIDHIDGNHQNNNEDNIRLICPNCHAQTPTYKAKNKGNGRVWRKKYAS